MTVDFLQSPHERFGELKAEARRLLRTNELEKATAAFLKLNRMIAFSDQDLMQTVVGLYDLQGKREAIAHLWKEAAYCTLARGEENLFFTYLTEAAQHRSTHKEIGALVNAYAAQHPFRSTLTAKNNRVREPSDKLRVAFLIPEIDLRSHFAHWVKAIAEFRDSSKYSIYFYTEQPLELELESFGSVLRHPEQDLSNFEKISYFVNQLTQDRIDIAIYYKLNVSPVYNFLSHLRPTPVQVLLNVSTSHSSQAYFDLGFCHPKLAQELPYPSTPYEPLLRMKVEHSIDREDYDIDPNATVVATYSGASAGESPIFWSSVISLLESNPDLVFLAIGLEELGNTYISDDSPLRDRIKTVPANENALELLMLGDIFLETFPIGNPEAAIYAMNGGLPVVTFAPDRLTMFKPNEATRSAHLLPNSETVAPAGNTDNWRQIVDRLVTDREWRKEQGELQQEHSKRYAPDEIADRTLTVISEVANRVINRRPIELNEEPEEVLTPTSTNGILSFAEGELEDSDSSISELSAQLRDAQSESVERADKLIDQAILKLQEEEYQEAYDTITEAEQLHPNIPHLHYTRALCLIGLKRPTEAIAELEHELEIAPEHQGSLALLEELASLTEDSFDKETQSE